MKLIGGLFGMALAAAACTGGSGEGGVGIGDGGGVVGGGGDWDAVVSSFAESICEMGAQCFGEGKAECLAEIEQEMAAAEVELGPSGQPACIACMNVMSTEADKMMAPDCDVRAINEDAIFAACDLDPTVDFDQDGDPTNDEDEACAGFPTL